ncbi:MAG: GntR family transcriptional regulator, partial [Myxococcota bacterium]|nr:GntR family transcriptional regulator [Myxococcota bacterium]
MISELANQVEAEWEKQNIHAARASDRVANRLRFDILSGKLPAGCRLLPERRLAEVLNVSRVTVRSAIATLQSEQLLDVRRGSGITVMDYRRSSSIDLFTWLMAGKTLPIEQQFKIFSQVAMVRRRLALPTLLEAIDRAKPADIRRLEQLIQKQQENLDKPDAYLVTDLEISQCIARTADNVVVELLHNSLRRCMGARA